MSNWRDELPDDLKGNEALSNFESIDQLAKSFVETKKFQGESIRIPGEDAGEDAIKEFNTKLLDKVPNLMPKPNLDSEDQAIEFFRSIGMPETVSYTHLTLPTTIELCRSRWSPYH